MKRTAIVAAAASLTLLTAVALAGHTEPGSAKKLQLALVNAFFPCDTPNTATQSGNSASACTPAAPFDGCALTSTGSGKITMVATGNPASGTQDIKLGAAVKGLNQLCDRLCIWYSVRWSSDDCPEGSCTTEDIPRFSLDADPTSCCTVTNGACKIKTTLMASAPGSFSRGKNTGIELLGCGLKREFPPGSTPALACGILLK
jgi:hypothetical protein